MKTPWEKYIEDIDNKPDAEFIAWQKWIVENDTDDAIEHVEFMAEIFFYGMFLKTVEYLYNSMKVGDFRTVKGCYEFTPEFEFLGYHCNECGSIMLIAEDPVREQPNYCYNCGVKFDWQGVYEEACKEVYG